MQIVCACGIKQLKKLWQLAILNYGFQMKKIMILNRIYNQSKSEFFIDHIQLNFGHSLIKKP